MNTNVITACIESLIIYLQPLVLKLVTLKQQELGRPMDQQEEGSDVESHVEFTKKTKGQKGGSNNTIWVRAPIFKSQLTINISETCA